MLENFSSMHQEYNFVELKVTGKFPEDLKGVFYRNGPNPRFYPKVNTRHLFDGDGMIQAFFINHTENGKIYYSNRWVRTERYFIENRHGQAVFGGLLDSVKNRLSIHTVDRAYNTSNTNLIFFNQQLHSFWEFGLPYQIDPMSLDTIGKSYLCPEQYFGAFSAHPKIDPATGMLLALSYNGDANLPACHLSVFSPDGRVISSVNIETPYRSMIHDFAFTSEYIIVPVFPAMLDFSGESKQIICWNSYLPSYIGFLSRNACKVGVKSWFKLPNCFVYHFVNAYQNDQENIILDAVVHDILPLFVIENNQVVEPKYSRLVRWKFNLKHHTWRTVLLDAEDIFYHFPHCPQDKLAQRYNTLFASAQEKDEHQIIRLDIHTKDKMIYRAKKGFVLSEPLFVKTDVGEYVLCVQTSDHDASSLLIFDAKKLMQPIALAYLPQRIPSGFHGIWLPESSLKQSQ